LWELELELELNAPNGRATRQTVLRGVWPVGWSWIEAGRANGQWFFGIWYGLVCAEAVMYNGNGSSSGSLRTIERRAGQKAGRTKDYLQVSGYDEVVCERDGSQVLNGWKGLTKVLLPDRIGITSTSTPLHQLISLCPCRFLMLSPLAPARDHGNGMVMALC
jgi:hypothetical protein